MEVTTHDDGVPCWVDLGTDVEKAKAFYSALLGWECPEGTEETAFYSNATLKGRPVAGIGPQQEGMPSFWTTYVNVADAEETTGKVIAAGGQVILAPMEVMEFGNMAIFADPAGAVFGVWEPGTHKGAEIVNEPGAWSWSELVTTDVEGAKTFYGEVFGWGSQTSTGGPMEYTEWKIGERSISGMMQKPDMMPAEVPPHWGVYFAVADIDAAMARVGELGGTVMGGPFPSPAGRLVPAMDSHGASFNLIQLAGNAAG